MIKLCLCLVKIARKVALLLKLDCIDLIDKDIKTLTVKQSYLKERGKA
jgi:hypothetical protein